MVLETIIHEMSGVDLDSSEELQYGPGIVSKLKNRYLSLHMRKAATLKNMLDEDHPIKEENNHKFPDSSNQLFESAENKFTICVNRPKGPAPVMNEKEKPPAGVVKQVKKIFETRPERPTKPPQHTGDVAAKVATFKSIITKAFTKPTLKQKPQVDKPPPARLPIPSTPPPKMPLPSPIPDVSMINAEQTDKEENTSSLTQTPDLILHSSPIHTKPSTRREADLQDQQNCIVFKFTGRKDEDFVGNDGTIRTGKIEKPKTGEGEITILPGTSMTFVDYEEEQRSLEGPMSPCDVSFINDNILINGRSNLSQKTKKPKMKIRFVEDVPQIFVYPSEASMLLLDQQDVQSPTTIGAMGHTVPSLTGSSSMGTYTLKSGCSSEEFDDPAVLEREEPVLFSSGTIPDI
ncbi:PREDICTED: uncharacterized protein LOC108563182, partial [Nicrophorus vespilloides]|uniref:Uncharacterized protein LOC108563182 n=1 Tax=Nicrophorus vespilloides TaxID=110193 RepID=A0ABM1MRS8_NICVS